MGKRKGKKGRGEEDEDRSRRRSSRRSTQCSSSADDASGSSHNGGNGGNGGNVGGRVCNRCHQGGHISSKCPSRAGKVQARKKCFVCGRRGHTRRECPGVEDGGSAQSRRKDTKSKSRRAGNRGQGGHTAAPAGDPLPDDLAVWPRGSDDLLDSVVSHGGTDGVPGEPELARLAGDMDDRAKRDVLRRTCGFFDTLADMATAMDRARKKGPVLPIDEFARVAWGEAPRVDRSSKRNGVVLAPGPHPGVPPEEDDPAAGLSSAHGNGNGPVAWWRLSSVVCSFDPLAPSHARRLILDAPGKTGEDNNNTKKPGDDRRRTLSTDASGSDIDGEEDESDSDRSDGDDSSSDDDDDGSDHQKTDPEGGGAQGLRVLSCFGVNPAVIAKRGWQPSGVLGSLGRCLDHPSAVAVGPTGIPADLGGEGGGDDGDGDTDGRAERIAVHKDAFMTHARIARERGLALVVTVTGELHGPNVLAAWNRIALWLAEATADENIQGVVGESTSTSDPAPGVSERAPLRVLLAGYAGSDDTLVGTLLRLGPHADIYVGLDGRITHAKCAGPEARAVFDTPLDRVVLLSNAPYALPSGGDDQRRPSDPRDVLDVAKRLATTHRLPIAAVAKIASGNANRLYFKTT